MTVIIFDTETTDTKEPQIIEAAYIVMHSMAESGATFEQRYKPSKRISFGAMATHHITEEDLADCPLHTEFSLPSGVEYMIGHNIDFDWLASGKPAVNRICTLAMARKVWPDADSHSLSALTYMLADDKAQARDMLRGAHSAMADVKTCQNLLNHIIRAAGPFDSWEALWKFSEAARIPERITFGKHAGMRIADIPADYKRWLLGQSDIDPYLRKALKGETA